MSRLLANGRAVPQIVKDSRRQSMEVTGGLDADLKARENAKRDNSLEDDCCAFLTGLTGIEINDMMEDLKVGSICFLLFPFFITCSWFVFFYFVGSNSFFFSRKFLRPTNTHFVDYNFVKLQHTYIRMVLFYVLPSMPSNQKPSEK